MHRKSVLSTELIESLVRLRERFKRSDLRVREMSPDLSMS